MKKNTVVVKNQVILNLIQDLQRLLLQLINNIRGRSRIKYGMTPLFNNGGFTLIELLVVVLIIGILAAVALPQYQFAVEKARITEALTNVRAIANANQVFYLEHGRYADITELNSLPIDIVSETNAFRYATTGAVDKDYIANAKRKAGSTAYAYSIYISKNNLGAIRCYPTGAISSIQSKLCTQIF